MYTSMTLATQQRGQDMRKQGYQIACICNYTCVDPNQ